MTPKEKAIELAFNFTSLTNDSFITNHAKQSALIAVDEIIKAIDFDWMEVQNLDRQHQYWQQVKTEIENL